MRISSRIPWGGFFHAFLLLFTAIVLGGAGALAQPQFGTSNDGPRTLPGANEHQSFIRVDDTGTSIRKNVTIGLGKSVLIEFPRPVRDVMVSNPKAVDAVVLSTNRVFLLAREIGESNAFFFDTSGEQFATMEIYVQRETAGLESLLNRLISGANIKVEMLNQTVVMTGSVKTPADSVRASDIAKQFANVEYDIKEVANAQGATLAKAGGSENGAVINMLTVEAEEQVMLKVTVAEVKRTALKQLGINLGAVVSSGSFSTTLLTGNQFPITTAQGLSALPTFGAPIPGNPCTSPLCYTGTSIGNGLIGNSGAVSGWGSGANKLYSAVQALERDGLIRTLAEPNLTAISGESAEFLAGGEVPYVTGVDVTSGVSSVSFKKFGVQLSFTPIVLSEGRISLKIDTGVSQISGFIGNNPQFDTRQAKTVVELPSGGSLALAGLISTKSTQNMDGFPGVKDVPIIGTLFRSRDFQNEESELVVIVTPYLVNAVARQKLAAPTDGLVPATDLKADFLGHLNRIYGKGENAPSGGLKGDYGFIVE
jgi:pilus assembly protein CpaC